MPPRKNSDVDNAASAVRDLTVAVRQFGEDVQVLKSTDVRRRRILRILAVSLAFDFVLSIALGWVGVTAKTASSEATRSSSTSRVTCVALNEAGAGQQKLWGPILNRPSSTPPGTPAEAKIAEETKRIFLAALADVSRQRDCSKLD